MSIGRAPAGSAQEAGLRSGPDGRRDLLLTFFSDTWNDAVARGLCFTLDRMVVEAARHPEVRSLVVANAARNAAAEGVRRLQGRRVPPMPDRVELARPSRLRRHDPISLPALARSYRSYWHQLDRAARRAGQQQPLVVTANPFVAAFAPAGRVGSLTYYGYDDWATLEQFRPWWPALEEAYGRIAASGYRVAAVSQRILDRLAPTGPSRVIPNGVEPTEWSPPWEPPAWVGRLEPPVLLYLGNIGNRLDLEALRATAERFSSGTVLLVGGVGDPEVLDPLGRMANVQVRPAVARHDVPGLVRASDVGIMPHHATSLTEAMSPLKLYEYVAGGRPVVATDLSPVRDVHPRIERIRPGDAPGFADGVQRALERGPLPEVDRAAFVASNSWADRFAALLELATAPDGT